LASYPVDWVDGFTDTPFSGNGCAVVHDGGAVDSETCMRFVRETSLVECTFVGPSDIADFKVRFFLATREIPFAGHPTITTVASLSHRGLIGDHVAFETGAGIVRCQIADGWITMTQVAPTFGAQVPAEIVAPAGSLSPGDIIYPPGIAATGLPFCITVLRDIETLRRVRIDVPALEAFNASLDLPKGAFIEPYYVVLQGATEAGDTFARLVLPPPMRPEDPFTGSATGAAAAFLWNRGLIESPNYVAEQGHDLGRPGQARVEVLGPRDAISGVRVSGQAHVLMSGDLLL